MGYYIKNAEIAAINRELGKKKKMGCLSWLGVLFLTLLALITFFSMKSMDLSDATSDDTESAAATSSPSPELAEDDAKESQKYLKREEIFYPFRKWTDARERTVRARLVKALPSEIVLQLKDGKRKKFPIGGFSKNDVFYIRAVAALPDRVPIRDLESRKWETFDGEIVTGSLAYVADSLMLIHTKRGYEACLTADFIFADIEYVDKNR